MELGVPEITGGGAVGLGTILVWQLVRLVGKMQVYFDGMTEHRVAMESKLDALISAVRAIGKSPQSVVQPVQPMAPSRPRVKQIAER